MIDACVAEPSGPAVRFLILGKCLQLARKRFPAEVPDLDQGFPQWLVFRLLEGNDLLDARWRQQIHLDRDGSEAIILGALGPVDVSSLGVTEIAKVDGIFTKTPVARNLEPHAFGKLDIRHDTALGEKLPEELDRHDPILPDDRVPVGLSLYNDRAQIQIMDGIGSQKAREPAAQQ
jgi:hypothetical protein